MGYYLLVTENGQTLEFGPIANDNPKRDTYEDERIRKQSDKWVKRLNKIEGLICETVER